MRGVVRRSPRPATQEFDTRVGTRRGLPTTTSAHKSLNAPDRTTVGRLTYNSNDLGVLDDDKLGVR